MNYLSYQNARDTVWGLIIKHDISSLPVKISEVCRREGIRMISYSAGRELIKFLCLENYAEANDGFSTESSGSRIIFYNDKCTVGRQRFTVAHELGHHILGHVGKYALTCREPHAEDNPIEREANVFASRLLAPACVLWGLGVQSADEISRLCGISRQAAEFRMERMKLLYQRKRFLISPLEWEVYALFKPYIRKHRRTWYRKL